MVSCRGNACFIWVSWVILNKFSSSLLVRDDKSIKLRCMPVLPYPPGVNFIKLDYFTSEFNRIQPHIHLSGMNVVLDPLPNVVKIWLVHNIKLPYHSLPDQLKSRQNYRPLTHLQSARYYGLVCILLLFGTVMTDAKHLVSLCSWVH